MGNASMLRHLMAVMEQLQQQKQALQEQLENLQRENAKTTISEVYASSPFVDSIIAAPIPKNLEIPSTIEPYDGTTDPHEHLLSFKVRMSMYNSTESLLCKVFVTTLRKSAVTWFVNLPPRSITSFTQLSRKFLAQFLFNMTQMQDESLGDFLGRFNRAVKYSSENGPRAGPYSEVESSDAKRRRRY